MKISIIHSMFFVLLLTCFVQPSNAQDCPVEDVNLIFGPVTQSGDQLSVDVGITGLPDELLGMNITVNIDPDAVIDPATEDSNDPIFDPIQNFDIDINGGQSVNLGWLNFGGPISFAQFNGEMTLFTLIFSGDIGDCFDLDFSVASVFMFGDDILNFTACEYNLSDPLNVCIEGRTLSGLIETLPPLDCDDNQDHGVPDVNIDITEHAGELVCNTLTNAAGEYDCAVSPGESFLITPTKENNLDCGLTILDLQILLNHLLFGTFLTEPWELIAADINENGIVSIWDYRLIRDIIQGNVLPVEVSSWTFVPTTTYGSFPIVYPMNTYYPPSFDPFILFNPAGTSENLDFIGIKLGDVNGSCESCSDEGPIVIRMAATQQDLWMANQSIAKGEIVDVPLRVRDFNNQSVYGLELSVDMEQFEIVEILEGDLEGEQSISILEDGIVRSTWFSLNPDGVSLADDEALMTLRLKAKKNTETLSAHFQLHEKGIDNEIYKQGSTDAGVWNLSIEESANSTMLQNIRVFPNPFKGQTQLEFALAKEGPVTVRVFNSLGQSLYEFQQSLPAGVHQLPITNIAEKGLLFYSIETSDKHFSGKLFQE